jgi:hypothetical protein
VLEVLALILTGVALFVRDKQKLSQLPAEQQAKLIEIEPYLKPLIERLEEAA